jgi:hypothetical protein
MHVVCFLVMFEVGSCGYSVRYEVWSHELETVHLSEEEDTKHKDKLIIRSYVTCDKRLDVLAHADFT